MCLIPRRRSHKTHRHCALVRNAVLLLTPSQNTVRTVLLLADVKSNRIHSVWGSLNAPHQNCPSWSTGVNRNNPLQAKTTLWTWIQIKWILYMWMCGGIRLWQWCHHQYFGYDRWGVARWRRRCRYIHLTGIWRWLQMQHICLHSHSNSIKSFLKATVIHELYSEYPTFCVSCGGS